ncbi:MAG: radical SAM protein [Candidatus Sumerlaeota bacterium]|nr:radical SAM protein [Candidatus Sumerlaeota bacterium]
MSLRPVDIYKELLESETGTILKPGAQPLDVALVFPNTYHIGMSSLGYQAVYAWANAVSGVRAERYFHDLPRLETLESRLPLDCVDVLAFSISFVLDYLSVIEIIKRAGLPLLARDRAPHQPLIIAGGLGVQVNPRPLADVCDAFFLGADQASITRIFEDCARLRDDRPALLQTLARIPDVIIPSAECRVPSSESHALNPEPRIPNPEPKTPLHSIILTDRTEFAGKCLIEISRGCPHHCMFCWAGHNIKPYEFYPASAVISAMEIQRERTRSFGLIAAAVGAHPEIDAICAYCDREDLLVSFSSLRIEDVTPAMLASLARSGQRSITLAPETASPRLRRLIGKQIEDEQIYRVMEQAIALGIRDLKLYFMIGLPTESDEEAMEIAEFAGRLRERFVNASRPKGAIGTITINLGIYVPEPHTPLPRVGPPPPEAILRKRMQSLTRALMKIPNLRVLPASVDEAAAQTLLANGGPETLAFLEQALAANGRWSAALKSWRDQ